MPGMMSRPATTPKNNRRPNAPSTSRYARCARKVKGYLGSVRESLHPPIPDAGGHAGEGNPLSKPPPAGMRVDIRQRPGYPPPTFAQHSGKTADRIASTLYGPVRQFPSQGRCRWCLDAEGPINVTVFL